MGKILAAGLLALCTLWVCAKNCQTFLPVKTGAEQLETLLPLLQNKTVALVVNQTSVVGTSQTHLLDTLLTYQIKIKKVFVPEHGFRGKAGAGETLKDQRDTKTGLLLISLYGKYKKPTQEHLKDIDVIIFDVQDVGARFYTYISTLTYVMEACAENGKKIIVLDRPNPCDYVAGPVLQQPLKSFVGMLPIPVLHGCTLGELAFMIKGEKWIRQADQCDLTVIPLKNWKHRQSYSLPIKPSPNLPNDLSVALYPSLCLFEATSISIGRGTAFPFQVAGAPEKKYGNFTFTPYSLPESDKNPLHKGELCYGIDFRTQPIEKGFTLKYFIDFYQKSKLGASFFSRPHWFDLLIGDSSVRKAIIQGKNEKEIRAGWEKKLNFYKATRQKYLLYP